MPVEINGQHFYSSTEVCERAGISRATLGRWLRKGVLKKLHRDRRGWMLFIQDDLNEIQAEICRIEIEERP